MYPEINIFGIKLYPYGLMIGIGLIFAILLFMKRAKSNGYDEDSSFNFAILCGISGILGAKLLYIIVEFPEIIKEPYTIISDFRNGFVFYGGVFLGVLAGYLYVRFKKWSFIKTLDLVAPSIPLAQGFGRIGCFFAGCCYGKETSSFLGVELNNSPYAPHNVHLIPTQLISSIGNFILFGILLWFDKNKKTKDGQTGALYLILYSVFRFIVEFFRGDPRGSVAKVLSTSQFICIFVFIAGIIIMFKMPDIVVEGEVETAAGSEDIVNFDAVDQTDCESKEVKGNSSKEDVKEEINKD